MKYLVRFAWIISMLSAVAGAAYGTIILLTDDSPVRLVGILDLLAAGFLALVLMDEYERVWLK